MGERSADDERENMHVEDGWSLLDTNFPPDSHVETASALSSRRYWQTHEATYDTLARRLTSLTRLETNFPPQRYAPPHPSASGRCLLRD